MLIFYAWYFSGLRITGLTQGVVRGREPWWTPLDSEFLRAGTVSHPSLDHDCPSLYTLLVFIFKIMETQTFPKACGGSMGLFYSRESKSLVTRQVGPYLSSDGARRRFAGCPCRSSDPRGGGTRNQIGQPRPPFWTPQLPEKEGSAAIS